MLRLARVRAFAAPRPRFKVSAVSENRIPLSSLPVVHFICQARESRARSNEDLRMIFLIFGLLSSVSVLFSVNRFLSLLCQFSLRSACELNFGWWWRWVVDSRLSWRTMSDPSPLARSLRDSLRHRTAVLNRDVWTRNRIEVGHALPVFTFPPYRTRREGRQAVRVRIPNLPIFDSPTSDYNGDDHQHNCIM